MRIRNLLLYFFVAIAGVGYSQHPNFLYKRKLSGITKEDWYSITIPNAMFNKLNTDFSDIRLYALSGRDTLEIPYLLKVKDDVITEQTIDLPVFNNSRKDGKLFFSFDTKGNAVNYLDLSIQESNFNAFVKIEGSNDQRDWFELVSDQRILSISNESVHYSTTKVHFPVSNYRYLRVSLKSDVPLTLLKASFKNQIIKAGISKTFTPQFTTENNSKLKQTIVNIKLAEPALINKLEVKAENDLDYYRYFSLEYLSDSSKTPKGWVYFYTPIHDGYLTSIEPNVFNFTNHAVRQMRLTITNQDNPPLAIKEITTAGPEVILLAKIKPADIYLFYGNKTLYAPSYDIIHFEEKIPDAVSSVTVEKEEEIVQHHEASNPLFTSKYWLWAIMVAMIGILGYFTIKMIKNK